MTTLIIASILFLFIGLMIGYFLSQKQSEQTLRLKEEYERNFSHEKDKNNQLSEINTTLKIQLATAQEKCISYKNKIDEQSQQLLSLNQTLTNEFKNIANEILEEKSKRFTANNSENIHAILSPLNQEISAFKERINEVYFKESTERTVLERKIADLIQLNNQISQEASKLTQALKGDSKIQGDWGEMILERILENSGLKRGEEYFVQDTIKDEDCHPVKTESGQIMRPDITILYPDKRRVIVDSKVSLTAYVNYCNATSDEERNHYKEQHLHSVRRHIDELAEKDYSHYAQDALDSVMLFIPNEGSYMLAMEADPQLWNYAYKKRILLINPANLIVALKLTVDLWSREYQNRNAQEIADRGALLYDKCLAFLESFEAIGTLIDKAKIGYTTAHSRLCSGQGSLINQTVKLKELGIKSNRNNRKIPQSFLDAANNSILKENEQPESSEK